MHLSLDTSPTPNSPTAPEPLKAATPPAANLVAASLPDGFKAKNPLAPSPSHPAMLIENMVRRTFHVPEQAHLKALVLAAGLAFAAVPGQAGPTVPVKPTAPASESEQSRLALAKLLRRDETLIAAGMAHRLPPPKPEGAPWGAIAALAAMTSAGFSALRFIKKQEEASRDAAARKSCLEALCSEYRNVRLDALAALQRRSDLRGIPLEALQRVAEDADPSLSAPAKRLIARHPDISDPALRMLAERESLLSIREVALRSLEARRLT